MEVSRAMRFGVNAVEYTGARCVIFFLFPINCALFKSWVSSGFMDANSRLTNLVSFSLLFLAYICIYFLFVSSGFRCGFERCANAVKCIDARF